MYADNHFSYISVRSVLVREVSLTDPCLVVLPAEISASAVLISYWTPAGDPDSTCTTGICNNAMWVGLLLIVVVSVSIQKFRYT